MTEKNRKPERTTPNLDDLDLNKETVQDLTEADDVTGGRGMTRPSAECTEFCLPSSRCVSWSCVVRCRPER
jgi:hypothetical protein